MNRLDRVQKRVTKMFKGPGSLTQGKAGRTGLFSHEKRRLRGDPIIMFWYFRGGYREDGDSFFKNKLCRRN